MYVKPGVDIGFSKWGGLDLQYEKRGRGGGVGGGAVSFRPDTKIGRDGVVCFSHDKKSVWAACLCVRDSAWGEGGGQQLVPEGRHFILMGPMLDPGLLLSVVPGAVWARIVGSSVDSRDMHNISNVVIEEYIYYARMAFIEIGPIMYTTCIFTLTVSAVMHLS